MIINLGKIKYKNEIMFENINPTIYIRLIEICDINIRNDQGETPLHTINNSEILKLLINHKNINVNIQDNNGDTPFCSSKRIRASTFEIKKIWELFKKYGANIDSQDNEGNTLINKIAILASENPKYNCNYKEEINYLISLGCSFEIKNKKDKSVFDYIPKDDFIYSNNK
jgi:hypothetical protein